jgi:parallel beta-helix repeat protein
MEEEYLHLRNSLRADNEYLFKHSSTAYSEYPSDNIIEKHVPKPRPLPTGVTLYVGGNGSGNYSKIQDAIDNASDGDTVFVYNYSSPYYENLAVNKSIYLIGEDKNSTVIDGHNYTNVISVYTDYVHINGFTIQNGVDGILLYFSSNSNVSGNTITNNIFHGIYIDWSSDVIITRNTFKVNGLGIIGNELVHYNSHTIKNNILNGRSILYYKNCNDIVVPEDAVQVIMANCNGCTIQNMNLSGGSVGIQLAYSHNSLITGNAITKNSRDGIWLDSSSDNNTISGNTITNNRYGGIWLWHSSNNNTISDNTITKNSRDGIWLGSSSDNNMISGNTITNNRWNGIWLWHSSNNTLSGNTITNNGDYGIWFYSSSNNNTISGNTIVNNSGGVELYFSSNNNMISGNSVYQNQVSGIMLDYKCFFCKILNNICVSNGIDGIGIIYNCSANMIENNTCSDNMKGIAVRNSFGNLLRNNTCDGNEQGILLNMAKVTRIADNDCSHNKIGIYLYTTFANVISGNTCNDCSLGGISVIRSFGNLLASNEIKNGWNGIWIERSFSNLIRKNDIAENNGIGLILMYTIGNRITYNNIYNSTRYDLTGMLCFDYARFNYWGGGVPEILTDRLVLGLVWLKPPLSSPVNISMNRTDTRLSEMSMMRETRALQSLLLGVEQISSRKWPEIWGRLKINWEYLE